MTDEHRQILDKLEGVHDRIQTCECKDEDTRDVLNIMDEIVQVCFRLAVSVEAVRTEANQ